MSSDGAEEVERERDPEEISGFEEEADSNGGEAAEGDESGDMDSIRARVAEMEEEAEKLRVMQSEVEKQMNLSTSSSGAGSPFNQSMEEKAEADGKSIYVGNVDYGATAEELEAHFHGCGSVNRVTILCDKFSGHPKGFAYIEFADKDSVTTALALDESLFRGRQIKAPFLFPSLSSFSGLLWALQVSAKRTNKPGISSTNRGRGRGRGRGGVMIVYRGGFRGRGRSGYSRRRAFYAPY